MTAPPDAAADNRVLIPVRQLVEVVCRRGDLVSSSGPSAREGIVGHRRLQKKIIGASQAEYKVQVEVVERGRLCQLSGRIDIVHPEAQPPRLEEIKTTYCAPDKIAESQKQLHWAQLKVYGYCYLLQAGASARELSEAGEAAGEIPGNGEPATIELAMLWYDMDEDRVHREHRIYSLAELAAFTRDALAHYLRWLALLEWLHRRATGSARALPFPHQRFRPGQRDMAVAVYRCLRDERRLLLEAPTGVGKTISTLYPAVKAMGENHIDKLVYLTAKTSGREVARQALQLLAANGLQSTYLIVQAKNATCPCRRGECGLDEEGICPLKRGFYDRLPVAVWQLLKARAMTPDRVAVVAQRHRLCPFELSLHMLPWVDIVVCDFNYVFDPVVGLSFWREQPGRTALLIDEAHNLAERSREMYSASLSRMEAQRAAQHCKSVHPRLLAGVRSVIRALERWAKPYREEFVVTEQQPDTVTRAVERLMDTLAGLAQQGVAFPEAITEWLSAVYRYQKIQSVMSAQHRVLTRQRPAPDKEQKVQLKCLSAETYLDEVQARFRSVVLFSATLQPFSFYRRVLGLNEHTQTLALASPFEAERLGCFICPFIDVRYRQRDAAVDALVELIHRVYGARKGNYLVFFPSYGFMRQVAEAFGQRHPEIDLVLQQVDGDDAQRAQFLSHFARPGISLGFAILGGVFGEGIDYVGERLVGAIVVGVGLGQIGPEQDLVAQYYRSLGYEGFDFAYRYPGMTRVLQTAGRVIRTESDRGVLVLVDRRFAQSFYQRLYPPHWRVRKCYRSAQLVEALENFWATALPGLE